MSQIVFGAGCFWGVEKCFRKKFGKSLLDISVGYAGGALSNPTYKAVCSGTTNHAEVIRIKYDPAVLSLETLVDFLYLALILATAFTTQRR